MLLQQPRHTQRHCLPSPVQTCVPEINPPAARLNGWPIPSVNEPHVALSPSYDCSQSLPTPLDCFSRTSKEEAKRGPRSTPGRAHTQDQHFEQVASSARSYRNIAIRLQYLRRTHQWPAAFVSTSHTRITPRLHLDTGSMVGGQDHPAFVVVECQQRWFQLSQLSTVRTHLCSQAGNSC